MMIQRIAEALALQSGDKPANWLAHRNAARAALKAMEVPDEDMVRSVYEVPDAAALYSRMIATALRPGRLEGE